MIALTSCLNEDSLKIPFQSFSPADLGDGWDVAAPATVGIDSEKLKEVYQYVHEDKHAWQIRSLLVFKDHKLVAESYMKDPNDRAKLHPIWSNTKQVIGILTGMAIDQGLISINNTISDCLPQVTKHPEKSEITIEHLLTMKSGINYNNDGYNGEDSKLSRELPSSSMDLVLDWICTLRPERPIDTKIRIHIFSLQSYRKELEKQRAIGQKTFFLIKSELKI